jgi:glycosyltransferase involved in cell wall biosynthesis
MATRSLSARRRSGRWPGATHHPGVLFLINDLRTGGAERALVNYVNHVTTLRPVVALIQPDSELHDELRPGIPVVPLTRHRASGNANASTATPPLRRRGKPRGRMLLEIPGLMLNAYRLARLARKERCSTISTFLNRSHTISVLTRLLFARRLRLVINVHEMLSEHLQIHFAPVERWAMRAFIRYTFPLADRIVAVSEGVRADLVEEFGLRADRITVVHNPIDIRRIQAAGRAEPPSFPREQGGAVVVGVGRLVKLKAFDQLIRATAQLPESLRAHLLLIGEGEERSALERLIDDLGLRERVALLGRQSNPWMYMARADVVVLSSRTEAFPNVIGEALALSTPVLATACSGGIIEYLDDGECGVLVPPDDVPAMTAALERLIRDPGLRQSLGERGLRRVKTLGLSRAVSRYERIILEARGHAPAVPAR